MRDFKAGHGSARLTIFVSTKHRLSKTKPDWRWQLTPSGRFAHRKEYAESLGRSHNFVLVHYESLDGFRHEHGKDVRGHMFVMRKSGDHRDEF